MTDGSWFLDDSRPWTWTLSLFLTQPDFSIYYCLAHSTSSCRYFIIPSHFTPHWYLHLLNPASWPLLTASHDYCVSTNCSILKSLSTFYPKTFLSGWSFITICVWGTFAATLCLRGMVLFTLFALPILCAFHHVRMSVQFLMTLLDSIVTTFY